MSRHPHPAPSSSAPVAERVFGALERFLHVEAVSGVVLLAAAAVALLWANSPAALTYHALWHAPLSVGLGALSLSFGTLHFWINDGLMTIFFLVVGLEIRRESHEGALANVRLASLPLAAALGGIAVPAGLYLALNTAPQLMRGWAVPTATDIAFAVGVLALLGKSVPANVRVLLLALAIIDDIAAVIVIAAFYSGELAPSGLVLVGAGVLMVLGFQRFGIRSALAYTLPGAVVWYGMLRFGVHPTLAGVLLGLMTPVARLRRDEAPAATAVRVLNDFERRSQRNHDVHELIQPIRQLKDVQRELLPPVVRVQATLHPWVAYTIMPLFALANAGVALNDIDLAEPASRWVAIGIFLALVCGKPVGIVLASWAAVRLGLSQLPDGVTWRAVMVVGCLGGIGFTMAIFIATLAFPEEDLLGAAKLGVLVASVTAGLLGLVLGKMLLGSRSSS